MSVQITQQLEQTTIDQCKNTGFILDSISYFYKYSLGFKEVMVYKDEQGTKLIIRVVPMLTVEDLHT